MNLPSRIARLGIVTLALGVLAIIGVGRAWAGDAEAEPASKPTLPIKVEIKLSSAKLKPGEVCTAKVIVSNTSSTVVMVKGGKEGPDVWPMCWHARQRIVAAVGELPVGGGRIDLKPGESTTATLNLTALYGLRKPGQYLVSATVEFSTAELGGAKEEDRVWLPSFREPASFVISGD